MVDVAQPVEYTIISLNGLQNAKALGVNTGCVIGNQPKPERSDPKRATVSS